MQIAFIKLDYAGRPRAARNRAVALWSGALALVLVAAWMLGGRMMRRVALEWEWYRCEHQRADGNVAYQEGANGVAPAIGPGFIQWHNERGFWQVRQQPSVWVALCNHVYGSDLQDFFAAESPALLFLGPMKTPAGRSRLVAVERRVRGRDNNAMFDGIAVFMLARGGFLSEPKDATGDVGRPENARANAISKYASEAKFYFGRVDPANPSHLMITYEWDGVGGTIDGWLQDDNSVRIVVRDGPGYLAGGG